MTRRLLAVVVGFVMAVLGLALTSGPAAAQDAVGAHQRNLILFVRAEDSAAPTTTHPDVTDPP